MRETHQSLKLVGLGGAHGSYGRSLAKRSCFCVCFFSLSAPLGLYQPLFFYISFKFVDWLRVTHGWRRVMWRWQSIMTSLSEWLSGRNKCWLLPRRFLHSSPKAKGVFCSFYLPRQGIFAHSFLSLPVFVRKTWLMICCDVFASMCTVNMKEDIY